MVAASALRSDVRTHQEPTCRGLVSGLPRQKSEEDMRRLATNSHRTLGVTPADRRNQHPAAIGPTATAWGRHADRDVSPVLRDRDRERPTRSRGQRPAARREGNASATGHLPPAVCARESRTLRPSSLPSPRPKRHTCGCQVLGVEAGGVDLERVATSIAPARRSTRLSLGDLAGQDVQRLLAADPSAFRGRRRVVRLDDPVLPRPLRLVHRPLGALAPVLRTPAIGLFPSSRQPAWLSGIARACLGSYVTPAWGFT